VHPCGETRKSGSVPDFDHRDGKYRFSPDFLTTGQITANVGDDTTGPSQDTGSLTARPFFSYRPYWAHEFGTAPFLPSRAPNGRARWDACDVILVTGDAYVDHPSFGAAIIRSSAGGAQGFRVGIIAQPDWQSAEPFAALGRPTAVLRGHGGTWIPCQPLHCRRRLRHNDSYTPHGEGGKRPDRCVIVYAQRCREAFRDVPIVLGGIESSLTPHCPHTTTGPTSAALDPGRRQGRCPAHGSRRAVVEVAHRLAGSAASTPSFPG